MIVGPLLASAGYGASMIAWKPVYAAAALLVGGAIFFIGLGIVIS